MTTFMPGTCTCSVCGASTQFHMLASTSTFGSPDLDLRPAEMQRSTMSVWLQECPACGYVAGSVEEFAPVTREWLERSAYRRCEGIDFASPLAARFYRHYMIRTMCHDREGAFFALLHAAWVCDDMGDDKNARHCREKALPLLDQLIGEGGPNEETRRVVKADLLRRSGHFEELLEEFGALRFTEEIPAKIAAFHISRAKARDSGCYTVEEAVRGSGEQDD